MKKRIIMIIVAAFALLAVTGSAAAALPTWDSGSGVLVRHDDGYIITGTLRDADSKVVGTIHGTLTELTTGFNSCPLTGTAVNFCYSSTGAPEGWTCNLLGGDVTLNFQGTIYDSLVLRDDLGHVQSSLCLTADRTGYDRLVLFMWSESHVPPGAFPDIFFLGATSVQQISPNVWKWSSG